MHHCFHSYEKAPPSGWEEAPNVPAKKGIVPFDVNEKREKGACRLSRRGTFLVLWRGGIRGYLLFCSPRPGGEDSVVSSQPAAGRSKDGACLRLKFMYPS